MVGYKNIVDYLNGPTGVAVIDSDPVEAAKVLKTFSKEHDSFVIKGGMMEGEDLTLDKFEILATIDSRDVLLAKLAGGFIAPLNKFFGVGKALLSKPAYALQALLEQKKLNDDQTNNEEE